MLKNKRAYIETLVLFVIVMVTKYLFDERSELGNTYISDSPIFALIGQAWSDGIIPYRDLFDHKGPILFLFYTIATWIQNGIIGIMVVTAINLTIFLKLILSISRELRPKQSNKIHYLVVFLSLIFFRLTHQFAGLSEELSLVFILLPLLLCIKHLTKVAKGIKLFSQHPYSYSFIYGACFAAIAMIRINNAPMNVGIVLGFLILMLRGKHYKELLYNALYCLLGFTTVVLPIIAYFSYHDALYEMIYTTFIFNWNYRIAGVTTIDIIRNISRLLPCFCLIAVSLLRDRRYGSVYSYFFIPASIICICAFINGFSFIHYFVIALPFFILLFLFTHELLGTNRKFIALVAAIILLVPHSGGVRGNIRGLYNSVIDREKIAHINKEYNENCLNLISYIPLDEYNSVLFFHVNSYLPIIIKHKIYPIGKYFIYNNAHASYDKKVELEQDELYRTTKAKWILISDFKDIVKNRESFVRLLENYDLIHNAEGCNLYRRKDSADEIDVNPIN